MKHDKTVAGLPEQRKEYIEHHPTGERAKQFPGLAVWRARVHFPPRETLRPRLHQVPDSKGLKIEDAVKPEKVRHARGGARTRVTGYVLVRL